MVEEQYDEPQSYPGKQTILHLLDVIRDHANRVETIVESNGAEHPGDDVEEIQNYAKELFKIVDGHGPEE